MFDSDTYSGWRDSRIKTITRLLTPAFFKNKRILEVGCGYADVSDNLVKCLDLNNGMVIASEGRLEHIQEMERRQSRGLLSNKIKLMHHDCDNPWNPKNESFYLIIHWGLLYHLSDPRSHLIDILKYTDYIILETIVCDSDQSICENLNETGYDQALNGRGSRPSATYVENILRESNFSFKRLDIRELNYDYHVYDWKSNVNHNKSGLRRFWIGWKADLDDPILVKLGSEE